jgi:N-acetylglutamate synthase-like GNAT family acetyltransferase
MSAHTDFATLRTAQARDLTAIRSLLAGSRVAQPHLDAAELKNFIVAEDTARVLGAVGVEVHEASGLLQALVVAPAHRGNGLGRSLVAALESHARNRGLQRLFLVAATHTGFFLRRGYQALPAEETPPQFQTQLQRWGTAAPLMHKHL